MKKYSIELDDGRKFEVEAEHQPTQEEALEYLKSHSESSIVIKHPPTKNTNDSTRPAADGWIWALLIAALAMVGLLMKKAQFLHQRKRPLLVCLLAAVALTSLVAAFDKDATDQESFWEKYPVSNADPSFPKISNDVVLNYVKLSEEYSGPAVRYTTIKKVDNASWNCWMFIEESRDFAYPVTFNDREPSRSDIKYAATVVHRNYQSLSTEYPASIAHAFMSGFVGKGVGGPLQYMGKVFSWVTHLQNNSLSKAGSDVKFYAEKWVINPTYRNAPLIVLIESFGVFVFYCVLCFCTWKIWQWMRKPLT
jgi:hypothetical protein